MKTAKQIKVNNRVCTVIACTDCGAVNLTNTGINTKTTQQATQRACKSCGRLPIS